MSVVAIIPARAGSKGVPGKNLERVGGMTLVQRAVVACRDSATIDEVIVSSDGPEILDAASSSGAVALSRPDDLASDVATSESAVLHALDAADGGRHGPPEIVVFVQCTSPFIDPSDLDEAVRAVRSGEYDVVFSAVESERFLWMRSEDGASGINHDMSARARRQDREPEYAETGAFYVMNAEGFRAHGHRFFGRVEPHTVPPGHAFEIDTRFDLDLVRQLAPLVDPLRGAIPRLDDIDALVMDFDGVHTDNTATVDETGRESVRVNRSDGLGLAMLRRHELHVLILSTERNPVVQRRAEKLGLECISGQRDKRESLVTWAVGAGLERDRILYVGNDENDRGCLEWVGWPVVVADAHDAVRHLARCTTVRPGGAGAVREVVDWLMAER